MEEEQFAVKIFDKKYLLKKEYFLKFLNFKCLKIYEINLDNFLKKLPEKILNDVAKRRFKKDYEEIEHGPKCGLKYDPFSGGHDTVEKNFIKTFQDCFDFIYVFFEKGFEIKNYDFIDCNFNDGNSSNIIYSKIYFIYNSTEENLKFHTKKYDFVAENQDLANYFGKFCSYSFAKDKIKNDFRKKISDDESVLINDKITILTHICFHIGYNELATTILFLREFIPNKFLI